MVEPGEQFNSIRKIFVSSVSFDDAVGKAARAGFRVTGIARNDDGEYVAFGRKTVDYGFSERRRQPLFGRPRF